MENSLLIESITDIILKNVSRIRKYVSEMIGVRINLFLSTDYLCYKQRKKKVESRRKINRNANHRCMNISKFNSVVLLGI